MFTSFLLPSPLISFLLSHRVSHWARILKSISWITSKVSGNVSSFFNFFSSSYKLIKELEESMLLLLFSPLFLFNIIPDSQAGTLSSSSFSCLGLSFLLPISLNRLFVYILSSIRKGRVGWCRSCWKRMRLKERHVRGGVVTLVVVVTVAAIIEEEWMYIGSDRTRFHRYDM